CRNKSNKFIRVLYNCCEHWHPLVSGLVPKLILPDFQCSFYFGETKVTGLLMETDLSETQRRYAETVRSSAEALMGLLNDILDYSKIEAGKLELETLNFDLLGLLDDLADSQALRAHKKGLELLCIADPDVPAWLQGDPGRLRQILTNLVGNAIKFTHTGEVVLQVSMLKQENSHVPDRIVELYFSIRDTGIGVPPEKIGLLFNKFTQADASITREYGGTGLGLAISKQLVELMGGSIGAKNRSLPDQTIHPQALINTQDASALEQDPAHPGAEFWFTIQLALQPDASAAQPDEIPALTNLNGIRILVVDDNAASLESLDIRLRSWGMRPELAHDGKSALLALASALQQGDSFQIAILDMQMPGMDGETLGKTIKDDKLLASTHLILLSSLGERGNTRRFEQVGFAAYLDKPLRHTILLNSLGRILAGEASPSQNRPMLTSSSIREISQITVKAGTRILLVEDNTTNQQVALGILKNFGLSADAVANGLEALQALTDIPYDLVLMDVQMPEMDGLEATRRIRDLQSAVLNHAIPIVAMTARAMQADRAGCLEAGMNDYISKPVRPALLSYTLNRWLSPPMPGGEAQSDPSQAMIQILPPEALPQPETTHPPVFDRAGMVDRLMDDEELIQIAITGFLKETPLQIQTLKDFLAKDDLESSSRQAHTIKGSAAVLGGEALRAIANEMEKCGNQGDLAGMRTRLDEMDLQFERLLDALKKEL
ncbi:MAG: response regulator, partial [Chloroflexi bacterium]|nr:response regulator [Chloroflexota bacterium]